MWWSWTSFHDCESAWSKNVVSEDEGGVGQIGRVGEVGNTEGIVTVRRSWDQLEYLSVGRDGVTNTAKEDLCRTLVGGSMKSASEGPTLNEVAVEELTVRYVDDVTGKDLSARSPVWPLTLATSTFGQLRLWPGLV